jgi:hypothetical protein
MTFFSNNLMKTITPDSKEFPRSPCPLAIVDFGRKGQRQWTDSELESLWEYIMYCSSTTVVIVINVLPGQLFTNIMVSLHTFIRERSYKSHFEYGSYDREDGPAPEGALWKGAIETMLFVGISLEEEIRWEEIFKRDEVVAFMFDEAYDVDFNVGRLPKPRGKGLMQEDERELSDVDELIHRAPRFEMVGDSGGFVNPFAKPRQLYHRLIFRLSKSGDTILDFFSGGQVLKVALFNKRECFAYSESDREYLFTGAYAALLCESVPSVKKFFFEFAPDEEEELILVDGGDDGDTGDMGGPSEIAAGVDDLGGPSEMVKDDTQVYTMDPNERAARGEIMDTGFQEYDPLDDFPPDPPIGPERGRDRLEAPASTSAQVDHDKTMDEIVGDHQVDAEEGEIIPKSADVAVDEAGASTFSSSPLFCSSSDKLVWAGSSGGSPIVLRRSHKPGKSLGKTGYTKVDAKATHYVYKWGAKKGMKVSLEDAPKILQSHTFPKGLLVPVFGKPFRVEQCLGEINLDLQNSLGDNVIDEYGSFSHPDFADV